MAQKKLFWFKTVLSSSLLLVVVIACTTVGPASPAAADQALILKRLPTLTRTPLPTLTPTAITSAPAVAQAADAPETSPASLPAEPVPEPAPSLSLPASPVSAAVIASPEPSPSPTPLPTATLPLPTSTATAAPIATAPPTSTASPPPTATAVSAGWLFSGVRVSPDPYDGGLLLHGDIINNTGTVQKLSSISGTYFDGQGQIINGGSTAAYWPSSTVPPGGRLPFELVILGLESIMDFELAAEAETADEALHQEFEFLGVNPLAGPDDYCLLGQARNLGGQINRYLLVVAVLYDEQDRVINYSDDYQRFPDGLVGDATEFDVCVNPLKQNVARYELRAWGS